MENYYAMIVNDRSDNVTDYVILVNKNITPEAFTRRVDEAAEQLIDEGFDYDECYWDAICRKLTDLDFKTFNSPDVIYY